MKMFCMVQCGHWVWNPNPSLYPSPSNWQSLTIPLRPIYGSWCVSTEPDSYSENYSDTDSDSMQKCSTGTDYDGDAYADVTRKTP